MANVEAAKYPKIIDYSYDASIDLEAIKAIAKNLPVFLSSRFVGMEELRKAVGEELRNFGFPVLGWELGENFGSAQKHTPREVYLEAIAQSKIYVGILDKTYGNIIADGISATEDEYRHAAKAGLELGLFVSRADGKELKLLELVNSWRKNHTFSSFENSDELKKETQRFVRNLLIKFSHNWLMVGNAIFHSEYASEGGKLKIRLTTTNEEIYRYFKGLEKDTPLKFIDLNDGEVSPTLFDQLDFHKNINELWHLDISLKKTPRPKRQLWSEWEKLKDIALIDGDFQVENGDILTTSGEQRIPQQIYRMLMVSKGEWTLNPRLGSYIQKILEDYYETPSLAEKLVEFDIIETLTSASSEEFGIQNPHVEFPPLERIQQFKVLNVDKESIEITFEMELSKRSSTFKHKLRLSWI